jgi:hypothetical protein
MGESISCDPGSRYAGFALWEGGVVINTALIVLPEEKVDRRFEDLNLETWDLLTKEWHPNGTSFFDFCAIEKFHSHVDAKRFQGVMIAAIAAGIIAANMYHVTENRLIWVDKKESKQKSEMVVKGYDRGLWNEICETYTRKKGLEDVVDAVYVGILAGFDRHE